MNSNNEKNELDVCEIKRIVLVNRNNSLSKSNLMKGGNAD